MPHIKQYINLIISCILFVIGTTSLTAQTSLLPNKKMIDSLQTILGNSTIDSVKLKTNILLGELIPIKEINYWTNLRKQADILNDWKHEVKALKNIAKLYYDNINKKAADSTLTIALKITESKNDKATSISIINQLIKVNWDNLNRKYFLELHYKGKKLAETINDKKALVDFDSRIGTYYFFAKEYQKSIDIHLSCLNNSKKINYISGEVNAIADIGANYYHLLDTAQCVYYYLQCRNYFNNIKGTPDEPYIYTIVGAGYGMLFQNDSAKKYKWLAYNLYKQKQDSRGMSSAIYSLADTYFQEKKYQLAEQYALESLELAQPTQFIGQIIETTRLLKKIYSKKCDYKNALKMYELYNSYNDSLANISIKKQALEKEFAYNIEKRESQNKFLTQQNQLQSLKIKQSRYFIIILTIIILFTIIITYLIIKQNNLKSLQRNILLEQKLFRVQMNPHFMSNCLAAIQELIYANDYKKASLYLAKFSFFLRQILNHSEKPYVTLAQEIEIINLYIELEQLRFMDKFTFELNISNEVDIYDIYIPTLLTQPIIENAIWHGLIPLKELRKPTLLIDIYKKDSLYYIDIMDNGVGRIDKNMQNSTNRISKGTGLVQDKITHVNKLLNNNSYNLTFVDLKDNNNNPIGTKVTIQLTDTHNLL